MILNARKLKRISILLAAVGTLWISGCETSEDNKVATAQKCMDRALTAGDAASCMASVDGLATAKASKIRCAAGFLQQGFGSTQFSTVFDQLKANTNNNPALMFLSVLAFTKSAGSVVPSLTPAEYAQFILTECVNGGSPGLVLIAGFTNIATTVSSALNVPVTNGTMDPGAIKTAISNLSGQSATTIGNTAITVQQTYCATSTSSNQDLCKSLNQAIAEAGNNPTAVGTKLGQLLQNK